MLLDLLFDVYIHFRLHDFFSVQGTTYSSPFPFSLPLFCNFNLANVSHLFSFLFLLLCCNSVLSPLLLFLTSQVPASVPPELGLFLYSQSFQTSCHKTTTTHHTHTTIPIRNAELFFSTKANQNTLEKSQGKQMNTLFFLEIFQHEYCFGRKKKSYFTLKVKGTSIGVYACIVDGTLTQRITDTLERKHCINSVHFLFLTWQRDVYRKNTSKCMYNLFNVDKVKVSLLGMKRQLQLVQQTFSRICFIITPTPALSAWNPVYKQFHKKLNWVRLM